jgi:hypothetical protein
MVTTMTYRQLAENASSLAGSLRNAGPYVLLELVMPGGTLLALLLFCYRNPRSVALIHRRAQRMVRRLATAWTGAARAFAASVVAVACRALPLKRPAWCSCCA